MTIWRAFGKPDCFPLNGIPVDRRRLERPRLDSRQPLERALSTWRRLSQAWKVVFSAARAIDNAERMALAEAKLEECKGEIERLEGLLAPR